MAQNVLLLCMTFPLIVGITTEAGVGGEGSGVGVGGYDGIDTVGTDWCITLRGENRENEIRTHHQDIFVFIRFEVLVSVTVDLNP